jgi:hypothetical protein
MKGCIYQLLAAATILSSTGVHLVAGHSQINYLIINGALFHGFNPKSNNNPANVIGWSTTATDNGFVPPSNYSTPDIICHRDGKPAKAHAPVKAGDKIHLQWNGWPISHRGPVLSYLAPCRPASTTNGSDGCASVDKTKLSFFKIDDSRPGFVDESGGIPGYWATNVLIASNNSWMLQIPPTLSPGPYILRHELLALHYANEPDGAQNYPQCINLWVTAGTSNTASSSQSVLSQPNALGMPAEKLYGEHDPGVDIDIYQTLTTYAIPGPTVVSGATPIPLSMQTSSLYMADGTPVSVSASRTYPFPGPARRTPLRS